MKIPYDLKQLYIWMLSDDYTILKARRENNMVIIDYKFKSSHLIKRLPLR